MNPFYDTFNFLRQSRWPIYLFWFFSLVSMLVAAYNLNRDPAQRTFKRVWIWIARVLLGSMWWQQTLWKLPPYYTDNPAVENSGLRYWMGELVKNAAFGFQSDLVKNTVLPHFYVFAPIVYAIEVVVAVTLICGIFTRFGGILGGLFAINLWLGLYNSSSEWPWTYFFLILLQFTFGFLQSGRSLGIDAVLARRLDLPAGTKSRMAKLIDLLT
jgi:uncharacterized membrane protein YphA (DoxX/SURF4 family)